MRFIYGAIAIMAWMYFAGAVCPDLSSEATMITCAIVAAGAMAGGGAEVK